MVSPWLITQTLTVPVEKRSACNPNNRHPRPLALPREPRLWDAWTMLTISAVAADRPLESPQCRVRRPRLRLSKLDLWGARIMLTVSAVAADRPLESPQ